MKNLRYIMIVAVFTAVAGLLSFTNRPAARQIVVPVAFYNLENLFDTIHDVIMDSVDGELVKIEDKNDYEYLPDGANQWNSMKYWSKQHNMAYALSQLAIDVQPNGPAIIGVSEIENRRVLEDLVNQPELKDRGYKIIHEEGLDRRGVDCAFLYNPRMFKYLRHKLIPYIYPNNDTTHATRGFLLATGTILKEEVNVIVNHWPSRFSGSFYRELAGKQVRAIVDSLYRQNPDARIIIMGDMNDDPDNKSMAEALGAKRNIKDCEPQDLWNPWWDHLRKRGVGTLKYDGAWNLFDQIVFSANFLKEKKNDGYKTLAYFKHEVFNRDFLFQQDGAYKGNPLRTQAGGTWLNGYSDHLPTIVYFAKEIE